MWRKLNIDKLGIRLDVTLQSGQSFRWRETAPGEWTNVLSGYVWTLKQDQHDLFYRVFKSRSLQHLQGERILEEIQIPPNRKIDKVSKLYESILRDYFQLDVDVESLFEQWRENDPHFAEVSEKFRGVRVLRQDPVETLFSFICSSNNSITRISGMVEKLCQAYGNKLGQINGLAYYSFPEIKQLQGSRVEECLRKMGFGYRAKFICESASFILQHHDDNWLENLRSVSYHEAHAALCQLPGVGSKVADCICLMSLDKPDAVPVDTHVWQLTSKYYMPQLLKTKSLTAKVYKEIGDHYRLLFGKYAGWAQSVLFTADLKRFQGEKQLERAKPTSSKRHVKTPIHPSVVKRRKR